MDIKQIDEDYIAHTYSRFPVEIVSGQGSVLFDESGKSYIDMESGIAVNSMGTADEEWTEAVTAQLHSLSHTSNLFYSQPCALLAKMLCERTGLKKVFFSNSGAEANECAIKAARKYGFEKRGPDCNVIVTLKNSFHGRTITTLAATGQDAFHQQFLPLTEGFVYAEADNIDSVRALTERYSVAAVMFEVVQGEGGVLPLTQEFVSGLAQLASEKDILLICDEVQIGNGRSGMLYGYMNYGISPDIVTTAKGLAGGLPLGATLLGEKVAEIFTPGTHGSTFGGNPICCAGAISVLSRLDSELLSQVKRKSKYIIDSLEKAPGVRGVTGLGLMLGIETEADCKKVVEKCREHGVLVITAKNKVRLLPPLNIPFELLQKAVDIIALACGDCAAKRTQAGPFEQGNDQP